MTENEIYCYVNGFLKWNISKKTSYIVGNILTLDLSKKNSKVFTIETKSSSNKSDHQFLYDLGQVVFFSLFYHTS